MIQNVSTPVCYKDFYSNRLQIKKYKSKEATLKVKIASLVGSAAGTMGAVYLISKNQSKVKNIKNVFDISYSETEILGVALSGVLGGLISGTILDEKKYAKAKTKEAMHQALANIITPLVFIGAAQKLYDKTNIAKAISNISKNTKSEFFKKSLEILPRLTLTVAGLVSGVYTGTFLSNKINQKFDKNHTERTIKPLDFMYHPDDIATALVLSDKNGVIQKTVGKIIPPIFTICGYEAGVKR